MKAHPPHYMEAMKENEKRYESVRKLGATHKNAYVTANCSKSYQYMCSTTTIHATITNKRLEERGLTRCQTSIRKSI